MSKRLNLREFQQNLIDRLQVVNSVEARSSALAISMGAQNWLVNMDDVSEVLTLPAITPVPLTKPWFLGMINVRGLLYSVIDVALYRQTGNLTPRPPLSGFVLLVSSQHPINAGLLVDRVLGLRDWKDLKKKEKPQLAKSESGEMESGEMESGEMESGEMEPEEYLDVTGASWFKFDVSGLLGQDAFLQIGV